MKLKIKGLFVSTLEIKEELLSLKRSLQDNPSQEKIDCQIDRSIRELTQE